MSDMDGLDITLNAEIVSRINSTTPPPHFIHSADVKFAVQRAEQYWPLRADMWIARKQAAFTAWWTGWLTRVESQ